MFVDISSPLFTWCAANWYTVIWQVAFDWTISEKFTASLFPGQQNFILADVISDTCQLIP